MHRPHLTNDFLQALRVKDGVSTQKASVPKTHWTPYRLTDKWQLGVSTTSSPGNPDKLALNNQRIDPLAAVASVPW